MRAARLLLVATLLAGCLASPPTASPDGLATAPARDCPYADRAQGGPYSARELAAALNVTSKMQDELPGATRAEDAACLLALIADRVAWVDGARYASLSGWMNMDGASQEGDGHREHWAVHLRARAPHGQEDVYGATIVVARGEATLQEYQETLLAPPPERVDAARRVFEASPEWSDVRERAPHLLRNFTTWMRDGGIRLFYSSCGEGQAGIPEHPFATVVVDPDAGRVRSVEKSPWWDQASWG